MQLRNATLSDADAVGSKDGNAHAVDYEDYHK
jgi:hypothetical protein